jgi:hypothetical protein
MNRIALTNLLPKIFQSNIQTNVIKESTAHNEFEKYLKTLIGKTIDKKLAEEIIRKADVWAFDSYRNGARNGFEH